jgi:hypothetical protein
MKGVVRFSVKDKLAPRFIRPFEIIDRIGVVAYRLTLPPWLSTIYDVFCVFVVEMWVEHYSCD